MVSTSFATIKTGTTKKKSAAAKEKDGGLKLRGRSKRKQGKKGRSKGLVLKKKENTGPRQTATREGMREKRDAFLRPSSLCLKVRNPKKYAAKREGRTPCTHEKSESRSPSHSCKKAKGMRPHVHIKKRKPLALMLTQKRERHATPSTQKKGRRTRHEVKMKK